MIRITMELVSAITGETTHLGTAVIANDGTGDEDLGNYVVQLSKKGRPRTTWKRGTVTDFARKRLGAWDLLYLALRDTVGKRNKS